MSPHSRLRGRLLAVAAAISMTAVSGVALATERDSRATTEAGSNRATLEVGSTGRAVKKLQRKLRVRPATGYYGNKTARAVRRFQRRKGLAADGVAGPATLRKLGIRVRAASYSTGGASPTAEPERSSAPRLPAVLRRIAKCESGGNPRAVSPDGRYRGKYQFDRATWRAYGGSGDPAAAPESVQDRIALKLYRARGTSPWPNCA